MEDYFSIVPGEPIETIAEAVFNYTVAQPEGKVVVDVNNFDALTVDEIMRLFTELPKIENFVNPNFSGVFELKNASWALSTAVSAVFHTIIYRAAPNTHFVS